MNKKKVIKHLNPLFLNGIAHRGLFDNETIPENSMAAFKKARDNGIPIELDVHLSKDHQLVVHHDDTLNRMTNKDGMIENLTVEELKEYHLPDGSNLPLFTEVLEEIKEEVPIVLELKVVNKNYKELSKVALSILNIYIKDKRNIMIISFDPRSLWPLRGKGYMRLLLCSYDKEYRYIYRFRHTVEGVDLDYRYLLDPKYQKYVKRHLVNAWTIKDETTLARIHPYLDTVTYQEMDIKDVRRILEFSNKLNKKGK